ncbi:M56 family peptidase, partial [Actinomadura sp. BRA 177]|nr:M56 family peptidase [Actinomadura sp. BRA 177]
LLRFAAARPSAAPSGTLGVAHGDIPVMARVNRLLEPEPASRKARIAASAAVPVIAGLPLLLLLLPH